MYVYKSNNTNHRINNITESVAILNICYLQTSDQIALQILLTVLKSNNVLLLANKTSKNAIRWHAHSVRFTQFQQAVSSLHRHLQSYAVSQNSGGRHAMRTHTAILNFKTCEPSRKGNFYKQLIITSVIIHSITVLCGVLWLVLCPFGFIEK